VKIYPIQKAGGHGSLHHPLLKPPSHCPLRISMQTEGIVFQITFCGMDYGVSVDIIVYELNIYILY